MFSPIFIIGAIVLIVVIIIISSAIRRKKVYRNVVEKDRKVGPEYKATFGSHQTTSPKTSNTSLCKTCNGSKKIKCRYCHGFGNIKIARMSAPTTVQVPKTRITYDSKGKPTHQTYYETQVKPGKMENINQPCGPCRGSGKVNCPDCN